MGNKDSREQVIDDIGTHNNVLDNRRNVSRKSHDKVKKKKKLKYEDPFLKLEKYKHPYKDGQFSFLLNDESVVKLSFIGEGFFGRVYKGHWKNYNGQVFEVAIKEHNQCKDGNFADAFKEISTLQKSIHPNIVRLFGIITDPLYVVMELCEISLLERSKAQPWLSVTRILDYAQQICSGMSYLESKRCVHCDLAARNILLTNNEQTAKISDFGMARFLSDYKSCYPIKDNEKLPVRWCAPEVLLRKGFSHKSDVWSFGVTMWEMFEHGKIPWKTAESTASISKDIIDGKVLKKPKNLSNEIYDIMRLCWKYHPDYRPTFKELIAMINKISDEIHPKTSQHFLRRFFPKNSITFDHPKQSSEYKSSSQSLLEFYKDNLGMEERELDYKTKRLNSRISQWTYQSNISKDVVNENKNSRIVKSMENLDLFAQNNCPLRKSKSMDNMLLCGRNCLTKHTEACNITISQGLQYEKPENGLSSNLEFDELTKQLQKMARKMKIRSRGSRRIVRNLRPSKINQNSLHKNKRSKRFSCAEQNANQFFNNTIMTTHSNDQNGPGENISHNTTNQLSNVLPPLQTHQSQYSQMSQVHISQQQQPNIPPNSHVKTICYANNENCCPCTRHFDLSSTLHSLLLFTSALQATEMIKDIQEDFKNQEYMLCSHRCCPTQKSPNQRTVSRVSPSLTSSSSDYYAHSMSDPASAGSTASIQYPSIRHAPQVPSHQSTPPTNIAAPPLVNVPVHPSYPNTASASLFNSVCYSSESSTSFYQPHALQTQFTPQISYPFEPTSSRSASLNSNQNQNNAVIGSAISQFTFNPNNCALNQANTSSTNLNQNHHMMQITNDNDQPTTSQRSSFVFTPNHQQIHRQPFFSDSISNNVPSTSSNLISSHNSIATHMDTSDNQTTSPIDISIDSNNMTSRKRHKTNGNNRSRKIERMKQDKIEIEKKNRETTRRLQNTILEKSDVNNKKIENVEKKVDNLSQNIGNVERKIDNLSQDVKNLMQNLSQLSISHASWNAYGCSSQSIPSNSNSTPIHNTVHVTQSGITSSSYIDQFHQQESIIRDSSSSSGCSSDNDIRSLLNI